MTEDHRHVGGLRRFINLCVDVDVVVSDDTCLFAGQRAVWRRQQVEPTTDEASFGEYSYGGTSGN